MKKYLKQPLASTNLDRQGERVPLRAKVDTHSKALNTYLKDQQFGRKHQEFDGETMGNSAPVSAAGKPLLLTQSDYIRAGAQSNPEVQIAALGDLVIVDTHLMAVR